MLKQFLLLQSFSFVLFNVVLVGGRLIDDGFSVEENPLTPKASLVHYWNKEICHETSISEFLISKASPLNAVESATYSKLVAANSLSTLFPDFCSAANLFCFPDSGASLEKHSSDKNTDPLGLSIFEPNPLFYPIYKKKQQISHDSLKKNIDPLRLSIFEPNPLFYPIYKKQEISQDSFKKSTDPFGLSISDPNPLFYHRYKKQPIHPDSLKTNTDPLGLSISDPNPLFYHSYNKQPIHPDTLKTNTGPLGLSISDPNPLFYHRYNKQPIHPNFFLYNTYKKDTVGDGKNMNPLVQLGTFFRESSLKEGTVIPMPDIKDKMPKRSFLPRSISTKIPFSSSKLGEIKRIFHAEENSTMEGIITHAVTECESPPNTGETKRCVGSAEDMIDFATSVLGRRVELRTIENVAGLKQKVVIGKVNGINGGKVTKAVSCHQSLYPYLLYYCHSVPKVRVYEADILELGSNKKINHAIAICHMDTSSWGATHGAFLALGSEPGQIEVCHWMPENDMSWVMAD